MESHVARRGSSLALGTSAFLAGASGMMTQRLGLSALDLSLGAGLGAATGLALYLASWALGAWRAGRLAVRGNMLLVGLAAAGSTGLLGWSVGRGAWLSLACLFLAGFCQGMFLPLLARRRGPHGIPQLWALNLLGAVLGLVLLGEWAAGSFGIWGLGSAGLLAALLAGMSSHWIALPGVAEKTRPSQGDGELETEQSGAAALSSRGAAGIVVLATLLTALSESVLLRLGALDLGSMHAATGHALGGALGALALGAWLLPRWLPSGKSGPLVCLLLAVLAHGLWFWPSFHVGVEELYRWKSDGLGGLLGGVMLASPLLPLGALVPTVHRALEGESGRRLGDMLLPEALGAFLVLPLLWLGSGFFGAQGFLVLCAGLLVILAWGLNHRGVASWAGLAAIGLGLLPAPSLQTPTLRRSEFQLLSHTNGPHFTVAVVEDQLRGERTLLTDGFRATATGADYHYMRALGHLPAILHPAPRRSAVLAFGTGTTAGALAMHPEVEELHILELSAAVIDQASFFAQVNRSVLQDPRVRLRLGDGRRSLSEMEGELDLLTMEPLLPDAPGAVYLYTEEFYRIAREALAPGGILCQWVPPHALQPKTCRAVMGAFASSFPWAGVFQYGSQWILIGAEQAPPLTASNFPTEGALHAALTRLGLHDPAGVAAHYWVLCPQALASERALTDWDPWILHRGQFSGAEVLSWLPENMAWLRSQPQQLPGVWSLVLSAKDLQRREALSCARLGRELMSARRARMGGATLSEQVLDEGTGQSLESVLALAQTCGPEDPEVLGLVNEVNFQGSFSLGLGLLASGKPDQSLEVLLGAAEAKPRRSDVHLGVALAAEGMGSHGLALAAINKALGQCPGLLESRAGQKITGLAPVETASLLRRVLEQAKPNPEGAASGTR